MEKIKTLFISTHPSENNGISRWSNYISNFLAFHSSIEITYFSIQEHSIQCVTPDDPLMYIHPQIQFNNQPLTPHNLKNCVESTQFNIVFILGTPFIVSRILSVLSPFKQNGTPFKILVYLNLSTTFDKYGILPKIKNEADIFIVSHQSWMNHLISMKYDENKIKVVHPGVNKHIFYKKDRLEAIEELNLDDDDFIVLCLNKNVAREGLDLTIQSFLIFLKQNKCNVQIKLFLNCLLEDHYDILYIVRHYCEKLELNYKKILNNNFIQLNNKVGQLTKQELNNIYNASNVVINTCYNEGLGLTNLESAFIGIPQIVPKIGILNMFEDAIEPVVQLCQQDTQFEVCLVDEFVKKLNYYYQHKVELKNEQIENLSLDIVLPKLKEIFIELLTTDM